MRLAIAACFLAFAAARRSSRVMLASAEELAPAFPSSSSSSSEDSSSEPDSSSSSSSSSEEDSASSAGSYRLKHHASVDSKENGEKVKRTRHKLTGFPFLSVGWTSRLNFFPPVPGSVFLFFFLP